MKLTLTGDWQHFFQGKAEKVKDAAKKDTDLAKQRARTIYVATKLVINLHIYIRNATVVDVNIIQRWLFTNNTIFQQERHFNMYIVMHIYICV